MNDCIFCKIVKEKIPAHKVYEDDDFLVFLDIHPQSAGHVQVIPKKHVRWVWDYENIEAYFKIVQKIALAQRKAFNTDWILSKVVGDEVHHAHVWLFISNTDGANYDAMDFEGNAQKIRDAL